MKKTEPRVFYISILFAIAIAQFICKIAYTLFPDAVSQVGSRITEIVMLVCSLFLWKYTDFVQPGLGLKPTGAGKMKKILVLFLLAVAAFAALYAARLIGQLFLPGMAERPYFDLYLEIPHRRYYILVAFVQELLSKCVLQYGIEKTLPEDKWWIGVLASGAVFAMLHVFTSALLMFGAFVLAVVSGVYYHYRKDLWAIIVVHFIFGFFARSVGLFG